MLAKLPGNVRQNDMSVGKLYLKHRARKDGHYFTLYINGVIVGHGKRET